MSRAALIAAALLTAAASTAGAQQRTLAPGDQVRVVAPTIQRSAFRGEVISYFADTLVVRSAAGDSVVLPMTQIRGLARNEGPQRGREVSHRMRVGAFLGLAVGLISGPFLASRYGEDGDFPRYTALSAVTGLLAGGGVGALTGSLSSPDYWQRFGMDRRPPPPCAAGGCPAAAAGGATLGSPR